MKRYPFSVLPEEVPNVGSLPLGAVPLDGVSMAAIEGVTDQMWF
jgi:hypothetical protein